MNGKDILGVMIKIKDEMSGSVRADGTIEKYMTDRDSVALLEGTIVAIADASVLPEAPGAPPMLTIMALAKRLGKHLTIR